MEDVVVFLEFKVLILTVPLRFPPVQRQRKSQNYF